MDDLTLSMESIRGLRDRYEVRPHAGVGDLARQAYELTRLAFSSYDGVLEPSLAHTVWYLRRPGMDAHLSQAVLCDGRLVASVFVTVADVRLGGSPLRTGVVDTVMTHPEHRRRGLARRLLCQAIAGMRECDLEAALLYTVPGSVPFHFYEGLGFQPHAEVDYLRRTQPEGKASPPGAERATACQRTEAMAFLNAHFRQHDGYVAMDEALWRWRRLDRPAENPAHSYLVRDGGHVVGSATLCPASIVGARRACCVLTDLAIVPGADACGTLARLLAPAPPGSEVLVLSYAGDAEGSALLRAAGFVRRGGEVAMLLPLSSRAEQAAIAPPRRWYVLTESVIGV
ncbi:MAG: GNAT family N-acetyltransferase [Anaerolineae bacterium]|nr:GNAT family N-acetyltransferase [Anaerolineae bacterium]